MEIGKHIIGLQHIGIPTDDLKTTMAFFESLGFETMLRTQMPREQVAFMQLQHVMLEIYENGQAVHHPGAIEHIALSVDDIEACYSAICAQGYTALEGQICFLPLWQNGVRYFTIAGPEHEKIEFSQML